MTRATAISILAVLAACGAPPAAPTHTPAPTPTAAAPSPPATPERDRPSAPDAPSPVRVGIVLLEQAALPDPDALVAAYAALAPDGPAITGVQIKDGTITFAIGEGIGAVSLMPAPVPNGEAEYHAQFAVEAAFGSWRPSPHAAHLLVSLIPRERTAYDAYVDLSRLLVASARTSPANGISLGHVTHDPAVFAIGVEDGAYLMIWTGVSVATPPGGGISLLSLGMDELGLMDLLLTGPRDPAMVERFFSLLGAQLARGAPFPDGDTIGYDADEKLPIVHEPSPVNPEVQVWHVTVP